MAEKICCIKADRAAYILKAQRLLIVLLNKAFGIRNRTRLAQHTLVAQTIYFATHIIVQQAEQLPVR